MYVRAESSDSKRDSTLV